MAPPATKKEEAVIVGSGIGGLSMAIVLAKMGFKVTVIEKNRHPGGMLRSYVRQGVHCDVGLHYLGAMGPGQILRRLFDYLGITEDQVPLEPMGMTAPVDRYFFTNDGGPEIFDMPVGLDAYEDRLKDVFPDESAAIHGFMAMLRKSAESLDRMAFLFGRPDTVDLIDQTEPMWQVLDRLRCSPRLKSVLSIPSVWFGVPPEQCPQFMHTMTLASYLASAWRLKNHGAHMVDVLTRRLADLGGRVLCGEAVEQIDVRNGQVAGITLVNGQRLTAPLVVAAVHPAVVVNLLGSENVKPAYRRRIMGLDNTGGMFAVYATMPSGSHAPLPYNVMAIDTDARGDVRDVIYAQLRPSSRPDKLLLSLVTQGHDRLWAPWQNTTSGRRGNDYAAAKTELARKLIEKVQPILGRLEGHNIIDTYTPLTIRDWVNSPEGSAYGVMRSTRQMLSAALLNRTKVKGLYLAGQSVLAPGILGCILGSLVTAKFILGPDRFNAEVRL